MIRQGWLKFWGWYERHWLLNVSLAAGLFILQLVHLYWLSAEVVMARLTGAEGWWPDLLGLNIFILLVDYTEIPAIISTSLIYINEMRQGKRRAWLFFLLLNSQWLHIFWITDEFVVEEITGSGGGTVLPIWLAWVAIGIDYLEVPVMIDLLVKLGKAVRKGRIKEVLRKEFSPEK